MASITLCVFQVHEALVHVLGSLLKNPRVRAQLTPDQREAIARLTAAGDLIVAVLPKASVRGLTFEQRRIALLVGRGLRNKGIASVLGKSPHTVANQLKQIFRKLEIHSRAELARRAVFLAEPT